MKEKTEGRKGRRKCKPAGCGGPWEAAWTQPLPRDSCVPGVGGSEPWLAQFQSDPFHPPPEREAV